MNRSQTAWLVVTALATLSGCGGSGPTPPTPTPTPTPTPNVVPMTIGGQTNVQGTAGSGFTLTVTTTATWTARSDVGWIHIISGAANATIAGGNAHTQSTTGSGQVVYSVDANPGAERQGDIIIEGGGNSPQVMITQAANAPAPCTVQVNGSHAQQANVSGGSGSLSITASCTYSVDSSDTSWLHITSGASGPAGTNTINFSADSNENKGPHSGTITVRVAGATDALTVSQASGVVDPQFSVTPTTGCTLTKAGGAINCKFDGTISANAAFITSYTFTVTFSPSFPLTPVTNGVVTNPIAPCGFPSNDPKDKNKAFPFNVTLTVTTKFGETKVSKPQSVSFISPGPC